MLKLEFIHPDMNMISTIFDLTGILTVQNHHAFFVSGGTPSETNFWPSHGETGQVIGPWPQVLNEVNELNGPFSSQGAKEARAGCGAVACCVTFKWENILGFYWCQIPISAVAETPILGYL